MVCATMSNGSSSGAHPRPRQRAQVQGDTELVLRAPEFTSGRSTLTALTEVPQVCSSGDIHMSAVNLSSATCRWTPRARYPRVAHRCGSTLERVARRSVSAVRPGSAGAVEDHADGKLAAEIDPDDLATTLLATLEGGLLLAQVHRSSRPFETASIPSSPLPLADEPNPVSGEENLRPRNVLIDARRSGPMQVPSPPLWRGRSGLG